MLPPQRLDNENNFYFFTLHWEVNLFHIFNTIETPSDQRAIYLHMFLTRISQSLLPAFSDKLNLSIFHKPREMLWKCVSYLALCTTSFFHITASSSLSVVAFTTVALFQNFENLHSCTFFYLDDQRRIVEVQALKNREEKVWNM